jgi:hypothetical protein
MRRGYFIAPWGEAPVSLSRRSQSKSGGPVFAVFIAASIGLMTLSSAVLALELPKPEPVQKYLGTAATGPNYTVKPLVRSDGVMRIFDVDTPYGKFAFDGVPSCVFTNWTPLPHSKKCRSRRRLAKHSAERLWGRSNSVPTSYLPRPSSAR